MLAKVISFALVGLDSALVDVEVDISRGLPSQTIVGLPDAAVRESSERVRAAIVNSGLVHPRGRLTVNLAPADLRKEGPAYDLPIALTGPGRAWWGNSRWMGRSGRSPVCCLWQQRPGRKG